MIRKVGDMFRRAGISYYMVKDLLKLHSKPGQELQMSNQIPENESSKETTYLLVQRKDVPPALRTLGGRGEKRVECTNYIVKTRSQQSQTHPSTQTIVVIPCLTSVPSIIYYVHYSTHGKRTPLRFDPFWNDQFRSSELASPHPAPLTALPDSLSGDGWAQQHPAYAPWGQAIS